MKKDELEQLVKSVHQNIGETLRRVRHRGQCRLCLKPEGVQHDKDCPVWPLIEWRQSHHDMKDSDDKPNHRSKESETVRLCRTNWSAFDDGPDALQSGHELDRNRGGLGCC